MLLRLSLTSPFARKARLAAAVTGIPLELELADPMNPDDSMRAQNPLGKLPILVLDDGERLYDSRVICAYLDHLAGGNKLIPADPKARFRVLRQEVLADGLTEAGVLVLYEGRFRAPEHHEPKWLAHQEGKIARALKALEDDLPPPDGPVTLDKIALACALGFFDFRFEGKWREGHARLVAWNDAFAAHCPGFAETTPRLA